MPDYFNHPPIMTKNATIRFSHHNECVALSGTVLADILLMASNRLADRQKETKAKLAGIQLDEPAYAIQQLENLIAENKDTEQRAGMVDLIMKTLGKPEEEKPAPPPFNPVLLINRLDALADHLRVRRVDSGALHSGLPLNLFRDVIDAMPAAALER